jgi:hypothetical protein
MPHQRQLGRAVVMSLASWENGRCISLHFSKWLCLRIRDHQIQWFIIISH